MNNHQFHSEAWMNVSTQGKETARGATHLNKHLLSLSLILTCLSIITGFLQRKSKEKVQALHQSSWKARSNDVPQSSLSKKKTKLAPPEADCTFHMFLNTKHSLNRWTSYLSILFLGVLKGTLAWQSDHGSRDPLGRSKHTDRALSQLFPRIPTPDQIQLWQMVTVSYISRPTADKAYNLQTN